MAFSSTTSWEVDLATGNDGNGGGFNTAGGGVDYTYGGTQTVITYTDLVIGVTTTQATSVARTFVANDVGNVLNVTSGTGFTVQRVQVVSVAAGTATFDKSLGTTGSTGGTGKLGGSLLTPGTAAAQMASGNAMNVKYNASAYSITSASTNVAGGCVSMTNGTASSKALMEGYQTTHGDMGTPPLLQASGISTFTLVTMASSLILVRNISLDGGSLTSSRGFNMSSNGSRIILCRAANCTNSAYVNVTGSHIFFCYATTCSTQPAFVSGGTYYGCVASANSVIGFNASASGQALVSCVSVNNTGSSSAGFMLAGATAVGCTSYNNGGDGFRFTTSANSSTCINCVSEGNGQSSGTGYGYNASTTLADGFVIYSSSAQGAGASGFNNVSGDYGPNITNQSVNVVGKVTPTGTVFANAAGGDFSPNATAGGGALVRAAGIPPASGAYAFLGLSTPSYSDLGAAQHLDSGGSATSYFLSAME